MYLSSDPQKKKAITTLENVLVEMGVSEEKAGTLPTDQGTESGK